MAYRVEEMIEEKRVLSHRYCLLRELGHGGTARVYLVRDLEDGREYALKILSGKGPGNNRLPSELSMLRRIYHPAIPHIWRVWEEEDAVCILMDYVRGEQLDQVLRREGAQPQDQAVGWICEICRALIYLHGFHPPVIYRDMKPANIILQEDGRVKLIDFGGVKQLKRWGRRDAIPLGTPGYAAPEQYGRWGHSDVRTDIYCLGVTLYYLLTGHDPGEPPYEICPIRQWNPALSPELERIIRKCTAHHPFRRYKSCRRLLRDLEHYQEKDRRYRRLKKLGRLG